MQQNNFNGAYFQPNLPNGQSQEMANLQQKRKKEKKELIITGIIIGIAIMGYLIIQSIVSVIVLQGSFKSLYETSPLFQYCFGTIAVHFCSLLIPFSIMALILRKNLISPLIPLKKTKKSISFAWICTGMGLCIASNYFVNAIISICNELGYELTQGETLDPNSVISCIALVFSVAIVPAIVEEYALRCCTLGVLRKYGKGFAIFTVSIVFGLLHGNIIQFIFAFLIGLILAYITVKTDNIIPAILIHAFNNGISAVNDIVKYAISEDAAKNVVSAIYIVLIVLAIIATVYLAFKKELLLKKDKTQSKERSSLSFATKLACLIPGFVLPFMMLIFITAQTIQKI